MGVPTIVKCTSLVQSLVLPSSFQEYMELYQADKGLEPIPGTENIPDDVSMSHVKAVWNSAVQLAGDFDKGSQPGGS